jgi:SAM-dependent methyltransferase
MSEPSAARRFIKRSRSAAIAGRIGKQQVSRLRARMGRAAIGATHRGFDVDRSLAYIDAVYDDYVRYAGLGPSELRGARVLEVGAGDNFGVALRFLAAGAAQVAAVDRFATWRDPEQQRRIYAAMLERLTPDESEALGDALRLDPEPAFDETRLRIVEGVPIEQAASTLGLGSFDISVSRAVLEHVYDLDAALKAIDAMLKPGGLFAHKVDLSDHGYFTDGGQHPLTILTVSPRVYRWMGGEEGLPNRRRASEYEAILSGLGYSPTMLVTHLIGRDGEIEPHTESPEQADLDRGAKLAEEIRPRLAAPFRSLDGADLATTGIFIVARKPGTEARQPLTS